MPEKLETCVPPWVQVFADLNPENVQIIEMTNPIITEMAPVDQPIEERLHESVFLLRKCLKHWKTLLMKPSLPSNSIQQDM